jgi:probable HAF family extracellular repeat protein
LLVLLALAVTAARAQILFTLTDLGPTQAYAINASGQVVGTDDGTAVIWSSGTTTNIGPSHAYGINDSGQIVGYDETSNKRPVNWSWNGSTYDATFLPGTVGAYESKAYGINATGQIVGYITQSSLSNAMIWNNASSAPTNLGTVGGGDTSAATAINASGQIVGNADSGGNGHAVTWKWNGTTYASTVISSNPSQAFAINASGTVVGTTLVSVGEESFWHAVIWNSATYTATDLDLLGTNSTARGINASGQVVGSAEFEFNGRAFYYASGTLYDLNTVVSGIPSGWTLREAYAINDLGQIVGRMIEDESEGVYRAFVLTPVPEPSTYAAIAGLAALGFAAYRRRKRNSA